MLGVSASMGMLRKTEASGVSAQSGRLRVAGRLRLRVTPSCKCHSKQGTYKVRKGLTSIHGDCSAVFPAGVGWPGLLR